MPDLRDHVDLSKVQQGLDLLEAVALRLERLTAMHEAQSRRWAELLAYLNPHHNEPDLADNDLFICAICGSKLDIENSINLDGRLVCPSCYQGEVRAL
jgi:formylmethanofuran dehydrogenase subunit E